MFVYPFPQNSSVLENLNDLFGIILSKRQYYKVIGSNDKKEVSFINLNDFTLNSLLEYIKKYKYIHINYNIYPREIFLIEKEIRGLIYKNENGNFKLVSRPFHKFYNQNESIFMLNYEQNKSRVSGIGDYETNLEHIKEQYEKFGGELTIEEKEDGTMIQIFHDKNSLLPNSYNDIVINTKGTLKPHYLEGENGKSHQDFIVNNMLNVNKLKENILQIEKELGERVTLLFEYINPNYEKHIVNYTKDVLFLIDIRKIESGKYVGYKNKKEIYNKYLKELGKIELVNEETITIQELEKRRANVLYKEGWVVKYNGNKTHYLKIKTDWYLNSTISSVNIKSIGIYELLSYYFLNEIDTLTQKIYKITPEEMKDNNIDLATYTYLFGLGVNAVVNNISLLENDLESKIIKNNVNKEEAKKYLGNGFGLLDFINKNKAIDIINGNKIKENKEYIEEFFINKLFNKKLIDKGLSNNLYKLKNINLKEIFNENYIKYNKIENIHKIISIFIGIIQNIDIKMFNKKVFIFLLQEELFSLLEKENISKQSVLLTFKNNFNHIQNIFKVEHKYIANFIITILQEGFFNVDTKKNMNKIAEEQTNGNCMFDDLKLYYKYNKGFLEGYDNIGKILKSTFSF